MSKLWIHILILLPLVLLVKSSSAVIISCDDGNACTRHDAIDVHGNCTGDHPTYEGGDTVTYPNSSDACDAAFKAHPIAYESESVCLSFVCDDITTGTYHWEAITPGTSCNAYGATCDECAVCVGVQVIPDRAISTHPIGYALSISLSAVTFVAVFTGVVWSLVASRKRGMIKGR